MLLHHHRPHPSRLRDGRARRLRCHQAAHVPPRAHGHRLPAPGGLDLPWPFGRAEHPRRARGRGAGPGPARGAAGRASGRVLHRASAARPGAGPFGRRAPALRDRPRSCGKSGLHAAGRAACRYRSHRGRRDPQSGIPPEGPRHRRADHRPQCPRDPRDRRSGLHSCTRARCCAKACRRKSFSTAMFAGSIWASASRSEAALAP